MTPTLTVTRGLPASGKTTWARGELAKVEPGSLVRLNRDDLRMSMHGGGHYIHDTEKQITTVQHTGVERILSSGADVIVDDTNLRARSLRNLADIAWKVGAEFRVKDFTDVPLEECLRRDGLRTETAGRVGEEVIRSMHAKFLAGQSLPLPVPSRPDSVQGEQYVPNPALPLAVMVDIDGTVALHGDRNPYDTTRYHEDTPNQAVVDAVSALYLAGYRVVFCSGRDEEFRAVTSQWLKEHVTVPFEGLFMRAVGDRRRDDVIKLELFDRYIRGRWNVAFVFDDRDRVVQAWRSMGLTVFQVAEGAF